MRVKTPCVYILASGQNGTLYIGVTSDIHARMVQHTQKLFVGFSSRYDVRRLVYLEMLETMEKAIRREKQLKNWRRVWKLRLIEQMNPGWVDLFDVTTGEIKAGPFDQSERFLP